MKKLISLLLLAFACDIAQAQKLKILDQFKEDTAAIRSTPGLYLIPSRARFLTTADKGANNGIASLDAGGKVPISQMPSSLFIYIGTWNPTTNFPSLSDGTGTKGFVYLCSQAGTRNLGSGSITYAAGDYVVHNGSIWQKSAGTAYVNSVNGQQGIVTLNTSHISENTNLYFTNQRAIDAMTGNDISMRRLTISGTGGSGFVGLAAQSSAPSTPASGVNIYAPNAGGFGWVNASGFTRTFSNPSASSNLTFTLPASSGTLKTTNVANDSFTVAQTFPQGTATIPSINFGTNNTGIYGDASNVRITIGGSLSATISLASISTTFFVGTLRPNATNFLSSTVSLTNFGGSGTGTLTNAPTSGNPTKWISINDNGTQRYIPCW